MAHSNRKTRKDARMAAKRARKAAWVVLIGTSRNKKQKSRAGSGKRPPSGKVLILAPVISKGKLTIGSVSVHRGERCYNIGCKRCSPYWLEVTKKLT